jgi:hypothetical protein
MSSFTDPLQVEIQADGVCGKLLCEFDYHIGAENSPYIIHVPAGFVTDFASTPFFIWKTGLYSKAACVHDWIYQSKVLSRSLADLVFKEAMIVLGVHPVKAHIFYCAVRAFGWIGYGKNNLPKGCNVD